MKPRAVLIAHRAAMVAEGLAAGLSNFPGIVPIGVVTNAADGASRGIRADSVAVDQDMFGANQLARSLRSGGVRVVMIGEMTDEDDDEGVRVSARAPLSALAAALAPGVALAPPARRAVGLTPREREIIGLAAQGLAGKQIARQLGISPKTVERHKTRIFLKLGVSNQTAAVRSVFGGVADEFRHPIDVGEYPNFHVTAAVGSV